MISFSCQNASDTEEKNKAVIRQIYEEMWNNHNIGIIDEIAAENIIIHGYAVQGREGYKQFVKLVFEAFPDIHFTLEDQFAKGEKEVHRWTFTGTHQGEWMGIPATGKKVTVTGMDISRFVNNKIVEDWGFHDALGVFQQLGAYPPME
ncbi:hypothetical protein BVY01_02615 [bacterium I07]|nr:hypothetical protein BVY01_02615 [bacterium I07]